MSRCWIALGGNLGDVRATLQEAVTALNRPGMQVRRVSRWYETTPVSVEPGRRFLNGAAELNVTRPPEEVLDALQLVEAAAGRERTAHWGSRTLDLDLLCYDDRVCSTPRLTVPHPALWYRRFVLDPLAEIAADLVHPQFGLTIGSLRNRLLQSPLPVAVLGDPAWGAELWTGLASRFAGRIRRAAEPNRAAIVFRQASGGGAPFPGCRQLIDLPTTDQSRTLPALVLTAALDDPVPQD